MFLYIIITKQRRTKFSSH